MQFPEAITVTFVEEESYDDGGFLSIQDNPSLAIEGDGPTRIATYRLEKVEQGIKTTTLSITDAADKEVLPPSK